MKELLEAFMALLDGQLSVNVYLIDVPLTEKDNYVIVRPESGVQDNNKSSFNDGVVIITDVVTAFNNNVDSSVAEDIDKEIFDLILPTSTTTGLTQVSGLQFLNVTRENFDYIQEGDGSYEYYRKISRYRIRIHKN